MNAFSQAATSAQRCLELQDEAGYKLIAESIRTRVYMRFTQVADQSLHISNRNGWSIYAE